MAHRRSRHLTFNGRPKRAHATREAAVAFAQATEHQRYAKSLLVAYQCDECPYWHLGNERWYTNPLHRVERELVLIELGERVMAHTMAENWGHIGIRRAKLSQRIESAVRKARQAQLVSAA